jgi:hypothetical protein
VLEKESEQRWKGECNGQTAFFNSSLVQVMQLVRRKKERKREEKLIMLQSFLFRNVRQWMKRTRATTAM